MRRREVIRFVTGAVMTYPTLLRAQQPAMLLICYLGSGPRSERRVGAFRSGLSEHDYFERRNVAIEFRWAENMPDRLPPWSASWSIGA